MGQGSPLVLIAHGCVPTKYFTVECFHFPLTSHFFVYIDLETVLPSCRASISRPVRSSDLVGPPFQGLLGFCIHTGVCVCAV